MAQSRQESAVTEFCSDEHDVQEFYRFLVGEIHDEVHIYDGCDKIHIIPQNIQERLQSKLQLLQDNNDSGLRDLIQIYKNYNKRINKYVGALRRDYDEHFRGLFGDIFYTRNEPRQFHDEDYLKSTQCVNKIRLCEIYLNLFEHWDTCFKRYTWKPLSEDVLNDLKVMLQDKGIALNDQVYDLLIDQNGPSVPIVQDVSSFFLENRIYFKISAFFCDDMFRIVAYCNDPSHQETIQNIGAKMVANIDTILKRIPHERMKKQKSVFRYYFRDDEIFKYIHESCDQQTQEKLFNLFDLYNAVYKYLYLNNRDLMSRYNELFKDMFNSIKSAENEDDVKKKMEHCELFILVLKFYVNSNCKHIQKIQNDTSIDQFIDILKTFCTNQNIQFSDYFYNLLEQSVKRSLNDCESNILKQFYDKLLNVITQSAHNRFSQVDLNVFENTMMSELSKSLETNEKEAQRPFNATEAQTTIPRSTLTTQSSCSLFSAKSAITGIRFAAIAGVVVTGAILALGALTAGAAILAPPVGIAIMIILAVVAVVAQAVREFCISDEDQSASATISCGYR